jgi:RNA polymerase sigma-70 factor (ECF subfamily)
LGEWENIVTQHGNNIMRLAYFYLKDRALAEDIMQEVFLRAYQKIGTFRGDSNMENWLLRITANLCKDHFRSWFWRRKACNRRKLSGNGWKFPR